MAGVEHEIAAQSGHSAEVVSDVLRALRSVAAARVGKGFTLPDLGRFSIVEGPEREGRDPFTGEKRVFRGMPTIGFEPFPETVRAFVMGGESEGETSEEVIRIRELPQIRLQPIEKDVADAGLSESATERCNFKIGGQPDWIQGPVDTICCGKPATFYGQFDSSIGGEFNIVDAGMLFVFLCDDCWCPRGIVQYY